MGLEVEILKIMDPNTKRDAYSFLCKYLEVHATDQELPILVWFSCGTISVMMQDIATYCTKLYPFTLTSNECDQLCSILTILKSVAQHHVTKAYFYKAQILSYLIPLLTSTQRTPHTVKDVERVQLMFMFLIGGFTKSLETFEFGPGLVKQMISLDIISMCLHFISDTYPSYTGMSYLILSNFMNHTDGLNYMVNPDASRLREFHTSTVQFLVGKRMEIPNNSLKQVVACYLALTKDPPTREALRTALPPFLLDVNQVSKICESAVPSLKELLNAVSPSYPQRLQQHGNMPR